MLREAAMQYNFDTLSETQSDVICEAVCKWSRRSYCDPDQYVMSRALDLYSQGNDTPERLFKALSEHLLN
jgi:hypothetical protein